MFYGFGSALRSAIEQREKFVRSLGIAHEPREERVLALKSLERQEFVGGLASHHGVTVLQSPPPGMRGDLMMIKSRATGEEVAYVLDQANRRLALVPVPHDLSMVRKRVAIDLDRSGRPTLRLAGRDLDCGR